MNIKHLLTKLLRPSMLLLFILYYSSTTLFYHVHTFNGEIIVHSHFYKTEKDNNNPQKKHSHPAAAYHFIHYLSKIQCAEENHVSPYQKPNISECDVKRIRCILNILSTTDFPTEYRGPPLC